MKEIHAFFCEKCGTAVSRDAGKCPNCGRYFTSVRCPSCGFTGQADLFAEGCPLCGYRISGKEQSRPVNTGRPGKRWVYRVLAVMLAAAIIYFFIQYLRL